MGTNAALVEQLTAADYTDLVDAKLPAGLRAYFIDAAPHDAKCAEKLVQRELGMEFSVEAVRMYGENAGIDGAVLLARVVYSAS